MRKLIVSCCSLFLLISTAWGIDLKYAGSTTVQLGFMYDAAEAYKKHTGKTISIMGGGSSAGIKGVLLETIDIGGAGRAVSEKEISKGIAYVTIAWGAIAVIVNKKNPVKNLTLEQLKNIHVGKITNWKDVGGKNHKINVVTSHKGSSTGKVFQKIVMGKESYTDSAVIVYSTRDGVDKVLEDEFAIGAVSTSFAKGKNIKILSVDGFLPKKQNIQAEDYKIARPLNLVTKGVAKGEAKDFIDFMLSGLGQNIISKKFISVK